MYGWISHGHASRMRMQSLSTTSFGTPKQDDLIRRHSTRTSTSDEHSVMYNELKSLSLEIQKHDSLYYTEAEPMLSDDEYDALVRTEAQMCEDHPRVFRQLEQDGVQTRFGGRVGTATAPASPERIKKTHLVPMLSLDNVHTEDELQTWIQRMQKQKKLENTAELLILTEPKLDGLSLSIRYAEDGALQWAATRGDGKQGLDVTKAVANMSSIPRHITGVGVPMEVRGEVVLPTSVFDAMNGNETAGKVSFSNARNAASGIMLRKATNESLRQELKFYAYDAVGLEDSDSMELRSRLTTMGFQVPEPHALTTLRLHEIETEGLEPMLSYHTELWNHKEGKDSNLTFADYDMDGAVHKVSSRAVRSIVGSSNRSPRWAVAHKFESQTFMTKLLGVEVQVGRTGALTPVAQLESVDINGVNVQRATLHNFVHLQKMMGAKDVPVGTPVLVRRAGEVIPQVVQRVDMNVADIGANSVSLEPPTHCPACSSKTVWEESANKTAGQVLRCGGPSLNCPPRAVGFLAHAFSRDAIAVTGLSEAKIQQLMGEDILKVPSDVFKLASSNPQSEGLVAQMSEMPRWGPKSAQNLQRIVDKVSKDGISLGRFIYSLGIRFTGLHTSNLLAAIYGDVDRFLEDVEHASTTDNVTESFAILREETEETKGVGPVLLTSLHGFATEKTLIEAAKALAQVVPVKAEERKERTSDQGVAEQKPWQGWSVVFTGSIPGMSRSAAQNLAKELLGAGSTPTSVSKSTSLVVAGEKGGKKLAKAEELAVPIMDAFDFVDFVDTQGQDDRRQ